jgi:hypothetical protein
VFDQSPNVCNRPVRLPTSSSATLTIACSVRRGSQNAEALYKSRNRCGAWYGSCTLCKARYRKNGAAAAAAAAAAASAWWVLST